MEPVPPLQQIRADFDDTSIVVYQAYAAPIAKPAVAAQRFVPPFKRGRMTWIKPSFLWTMYRCGWATKPDQERVLAITIEREGFEWALAHSSLSHADPAVYASHDEWAERKAATPVRIQWDPERSLELEPLPQRTIQVGLSGDAARRYVDEWTTGIADVTELAHEIHALVEGGELDVAEALLPEERPYPVPEPLRRVTGAA